MCSCVLYYLSNEDLQLASLEKQKERLHEELNEVSSALEFRKLHSVEKHKLQLAEQKIRDIEAKLELEVMQKQRLDVSLILKLIIIPVSSRIFFHFACRHCV